MAKTVPSLRWPVSVRELVKLNHAGKCPSDYSHPDGVLFILRLLSQEGLRLCTVWSVLLSRIGPRIVTHCTWALFRPRRRMGILPALARFRYSRAFYKILELYLCQFCTTYTMDGVFVVLISLIWIYITLGGFGAKGHVQCKYGVRIRCRISINDSNNFEVVEVYRTVILLFWLPDQYAA